MSTTLCSGGSVALRAHSASWSIWRDHMQAAAVITDVVVGLSLARCACGCAKDMGGSLLQVWQLVVGMAPAHTCEMRSSDAQTGRSANMAGVLVAGSVFCCSCGCSCGSAAAGDWLQTRGEAPVLGSATAVVRPNNVNGQVRQVTAAAWRARNWQHTWSRGWSRLAAPTPPRSRTCSTTVRRAAHLPNQESPRCCARQRKTGLPQGWPVWLPVMPHPRRNCFLRWTPCSCPPGHPTYPQPTAAGQGQDGGPGSPHETCRVRSMRMRSM